MATAVSAGCGAWFLAFAAYDTNLITRRFGLNHSFVTAKYQDGSEAPLDLLYVTMLREMGHALGLAGHSPEPGDVMFRNAGQSANTSASPVRTGPGSSTVA